MWGSISAALPPQETVATTLPFASCTGAETAAPPGNVVAAAYLVASLSNDFEPSFDFVDIDLGPRHDGGFFAAQARLA